MVRWDHQLPHCQSALAPRGLGIATWAAVYMGSSLRGPLRGQKLWRARYQCSKSENDGGYIDNIHAPQFD